MPDPLDDPFAHAGRATARAAPEPEFSSMRQWRDEGREEPRAGLSLIDALSVARKSVESLSGRVSDAIAGSARTEDGGWEILVDVIEAKAKMGANDLLSQYRITLSGAGELVGYSRVSRYLREEG